MLHNHILKSRKSFASYGLKTGADIFEEVGLTI